MKNKAIILLSGGLDSTVSLANEKGKSNIELALFFDYGQKTFKYEEITVKNLCKYYNIKLEIIKLDWLKNITQTSLVNSTKEIPEIHKTELDNKEATINSMKNVWIPNRNGLFINIAGSYADSFGYNRIIIGANKEEAETFIDNSQEFINSMTNGLSYSTLEKPIVFAPLINLDKKSIIELAVKLKVPFEHIRSCYSNTEKHCGKCESCTRLKKGLESVGLFDIVNLLFDNEEIK